MGRLLSLWRRKIVFHDTFKARPSSLFILLGQLQLNRLHIAGHSRDDLDVLEFYEKVMAEPYVMLTLICLDVQVVCISGTRLFRSVVTSREKDWYSPHER